MRSPRSSPANPDLAALIDAELAQLATDAQALRALLVENAVVTARVLPSNVDRPAGDRGPARRRVAAPDRAPGDVLQVRVAGFDGDRILPADRRDRRRRGRRDGTGQLAGRTAARAFVAATIVPAAPAPAVFRPRRGRRAGARRDRDVVDERAPAVAVSVAELPPARRPLRRRSGFLGAVLRANVAPQSADDVPRLQTAATAPRARAIVVASEPTSIEARMAAARATVAQVSTAP